MCGLFCNICYYCVKLKNHQAYRKVLMRLQTALRRALNCFAAIYTVSPAALWWLYSEPLHSVQTYPSICKIDQSSPVNCSHCFRRTVQTIILLLINIEYSLEWFPVATIMISLLLWISLQAEHQLFNWHFVFVLLNVM